MGEDIEAEYVRRGIVCINYTPTPSRGVNDEDGSEDGGLHLSQCGQDYCAQWGLSLLCRDCPCCAGTVPVVQSVEHDAVTVGVNGVGQLFNVQAAGRCVDNLLVDSALAVHLIGVTPLFHAPVLESVDGVAVNDL